MRVTEQRRTRRNFLKVILGSGIFAFIVSIFYPIGRYLIPPEISEPVPTNVIASKINELPANSGKIFRFGRKPAILINTPHGKIRAFTASVLILIVLYNTGKISAIFGVPVIMDIMI